ncbi:DUF222 domain-containing protein [Mycobacterium cookii]|uniref:DUF222 domain-containing protein n=1 Tax=Mycobacterium cookii TaxID=1775 RepID=UPI0013D5AE68|nr:DUF222 domain-containing protein [Mycobacterium cookii]
MSYRCGNVKHSDRRSGSAIAAELPAALRVSRALASSYPRDAAVLRDRLPKPGLADPPAHID